MFPPVGSLVFQSQEEGGLVLAVHDVISYIEGDFPPSLAEAWDNVGLQVGSSCLPCRTVMTCLTVTEAVVDYAAEIGVNLLVAHHPLIFQPLKSIILEQSTGRIIRKLLTHQISLFVVHTNVDKAQGGLNDWLADALELKDVRILEPEEGETLGYGRVGQLASTLTLGSLAEHVGETLGIKTVRFIGEATRPIKQVAVSSGSGSHQWCLALQQGADVLITGDVKYHTAMEVMDTSLALIDAGHFGTEIIFASRFAAYLEKEATRRRWPLRVITYEGEVDPLAAVWKGV